MLPWWGWAAALGAVVLVNMALGMALRGAVGRVAALRRRRGLLREMQAGAAAADVEMGPVPAPPSPGGAAAEPPPPEAPAAGRSFTVVPLPAALSPADIETAVQARPAGGMLAELPPAKFHDFDGAGEWSPGEDPVRVAEPSEPRPEVPSPAFLEERPEPSPPTSELSDGTSLAASGEDDDDDAPTEEVEVWAGPPAAALVSIMPRTPPAAAASTPRSGSAPPLPHKSPSIDTAVHGMPRARSAAAALGRSPPAPPLHPAAAMPPPMPPTRRGVTTAAFPRRMSLPALQALRGKPQQQQQQQQAVPPWMGASIIQSRLVPVGGGGSPSSAATSVTTSPSRPSPAAYHVPPLPSPPRLRTPTREERRVVVRSPHTGEFVSPSPCRPAATPSPMAKARVQEAFARPAAAAASPDAVHETLLSISDESPEAPPRRGDALFAARELELELGRTESPLAEAPPGTPPAAPLDETGDAGNDSWWLTPTKAEAAGVRLDPLEPIDPPAARGASPPPGVVTAGVSRATFRMAPGGL